MKNYKYFENVEKNAYFTDVCCQFCGSDSYCLEGVFFERDDVSSVCLECFDKRMVSVDVPDYRQHRTIRGARLACILFRQNAQKSVSIRQYAH